LWLGSARSYAEVNGRAVAATSPIGWLADHPLTDTISWTSMQLGRAYQFSHLPGAKMLLESGGVPLIEARTTLAGREVRIAFDLGSSSWTEQTSFPIFVSNLLHWIAPDLGRTIHNPCIVGTSCALDPRLIGADVNLVTVRPEETLGVSAPAGQAYDDQFIPDRTGLYRFKRNGLTQLIAVNAPAARARAVAAAPDASSGAVPSNMTARLPVRWWLLAAIVVLLVIEGWLAGRGIERFLWLAALARRNPLARRRRLLLAARVTTLLLIAAALAGMPILLSDRGEN